jgi:hypothetical protein
MHGLQIAPLLDFAGMAALILLTALQTVFLLQAVDLPGYIVFLIVVSAAVNLTGLFTAIAYQRSVFTVTFFFTLVFFSLAPMQQLMNQLDPLMAEPSILARATGFCLFFSSSCLAALLVMGPAPVARQETQRLPFSAFPVSACALLLMVLCVAIGIGLIVFGRGILTDRTTYAEILQSEASQPVFLLYKDGLRPFAIYGSVVGLWLAISYKQVGWMVAFGITLFGGLFLSNPLVTARSDVAAMICAIIFYFGGRNRNRFLVTVLLLGVLAAPLFNLFRLEEAQFEHKDLGSFLVVGDFDAFSLLCHTIWHVDYYGLDYGKNILSAIFFFVPRNIWPTKNEITPFYLTESLQTYRGLWNFNLSEPLPAEGYFAFGIAGVAIMTLFYICFAWFLEVSAGENRLKPIYLFCCAGPPTLFILMRGPLLVGFALITGHFLAICLALKLATLRFNRSNAKRRHTFSRSLSMRRPPRPLPPGQ